MKKLVLFFCIVLISGCVVSKEELYSLQRDVAVLKNDFRENAALFSTEAGEIKSSTKRLDELHRNLRKSFADTNAHIEDLEKEINKIKGDYDSLEKKFNSINQNVSDAIKFQNDMIKADRAEIKKISDSITALKASQSTIFSNISTIYTILKTQNTSVKGDKEANEQEKKAIYDAALSLYNKADYNAAIERFTYFAIRFPFDNLAANALYWIGECYYAQKNYDYAVQYFHRVVTDYSNSNKVAAALLKEAMTLKELGMDKESNAAYEELLYRFPYSEEAKKHKEKKK